MPFYKISTCDKLYLIISDASLPKSDGKPVRRKGVEPVLPAPVPAKKIAHYLQRHDTSDTIRQPQLGHERCFRVIFYRYLPAPVQKEWRIALPYPQLTGWPVFDRGRAAASPRYGPGTARSIYHQYSEQSYPIPDQSVCALRARVEGRAGQGHHLNSSICGLSGSDKRAGTQGCLYH